MASEKQLMQHALNFSLSGCNALITGGAGHLGRAICRSLGEAGASVFVGGRNQEALHAWCETLSREGIRAEPLAFDLLDPAATKSACKRLCERVDHLDILINNAHSGRPGTLAQAGQADFDQAQRLAMSGPQQLIQCLMPLLKQAAGRRPGGASIINIASMYASVSPDPAIYGDSGMNNPPWYGAAKAGMLQLSRYLAVHLAADGIRVNAVSPGPFPPASIAEDMPDFHAALCAKTPLGRIGAPEDLAGPVLFLASSGSAYVTGINLPVDGGWTAW